MDLSLLDQLLYDGDLEWQRRGACTEPDAAEVFVRAMQSRRRRRDVATAITVCHTCPVMLACRAHADDTDPVRGVWGGVDRARRDVR